MSRRIDREVVLRAFLLKSQIVSMTRLVVGSSSPSRYTISWHEAIATRSTTSSSRTKSRRSLEASYSECDRWRAPPVGIPDPRGFAPLPFDELAHRAIETHRGGSESGSSAGRSSKMEGAPLEWAVVTRTDNSRGANKRRDVALSRRSRNRRGTTAGHISWRRPPNSSTPLSTCAFAAPGARLELATIRLTV